MIIDSHQHFWKYNPIRDAWIDESMKVIRKDFLPKDLKPILDTNNVDAQKRNQKTRDSYYSFFIAINRRQ